MPESDAKPQSITFRNSTFKWDEGEKEGMELKDLDLVCEGGKLTAIVGKVGSGKSSLLSAILGEMTLVSGGGISRPRSLAYVPQQAWIQNMSLRDNVLFGAECDEKRYNETLDACALRADLRIMPGGDRAEIGEDGVNLSGGQKQRVSLARAAYSNADVLLLDDPLSAVDAHVARHIFEKLVGPRGILAGKTRLLVTHNLSFLDQMDKIVLLDEGRIVACGKYGDLKEGSQQFRDFIATTLAQEKEVGKHDEDAKDAKETDSLLAKVSQDSTVDINKKEEANNDNLGKIVQEEVSAKGRVDFRHYLYFIRKTNSWVFSFIILLLLVGEGLRVICSVILGRWTDAVSDPHEILYEHELLERHSAHVAAFGVAALVLGILDYARQLMFLRRAAVASAKIHSAVLESVFHAPMRFFDANPIGRSGWYCYTCCSC